MKFLIIGASGLVGSITYEKLQSLGHTVVGTSSRVAVDDDSRDFLISFDLFKDNIPKKVDALLDKINSGSTCDPVYVVVFAFVTQIDTCFLEKEKSYAVNVVKMKELLDYLQTKNKLRMINNDGEKIKIIFISSSFVFDGKKGYYSEKEEERRPVCEYGKHKLEVEKYLEEHMPEALVLRLDKMIGEGGVRKDIFSDWYGLIMAGKEIACIAGQLFSPTYAADMARGLVLAAEKNLLGTYHFANTEFFTREELARQFLIHAGIDAKIMLKSQEELGFADLRPLKTYLDSSKFISATGMRFTPMREVFYLFFEKLKNSVGRRKESGGVMR